MSDHHEKIGKKPCSYRFFVCPCFHGFFFKTSILQHKPLQGLNCFLWLTDWAKVLNHECYQNLQRSINKDTIILPFCPYVHAPETWMQFVQGTSNNIYYFSFCSQQFVTLWKQQRSVAIFKFLHASHCRHTCVPFSLLSVFKPQQRKKYIGTTIQTPTALLWI